MKNLEACLAINRYTDLGRLDRPGIAALHLVDDPAFALLVTYVGIPCRQGDTDGLVVEWSACGFWASMRTSLTCGVSGGIVSPTVSLKGNKTPGILATMERWSEVSGSGQ